MANKIRKKRGKKSMKVNKMKTMVSNEPTYIKNAPHTFVIHRGLSCPYLVCLSRDFRRLMEPFTASSLKERKTNKIKDFVNLSSVFNVSHMCLFTRTENSMSMKISRLPRGPTLTFKIHQFILARDVISSLKKQMVEEESFRHPPLVILNSFTGEGNHIKLMTTTFQNMFPSINLSTIKLSEMKRCVVFSYNPTTKIIDMRHYAINVVPVNINKGVKKVVQRQIPNLSKFSDISDFVTKANMLSDSEVEDEDTNVVLPQKLKGGNLEENKSSIRLHELGPRITFQLIKIEDELMTGEVLFHEYVVKTEEELAQIKKRRANRTKLKELRKKAQQENKEKKEERENENKKSLNLKKIEQKRLLKDAKEALDEVDDDDADYYRKEVGADPEKELFDGAITNERKRAHSTTRPVKAKKPRIDKDEDDSNEDNRTQKFGNRNGKFGNKSGGRFNKDRDESPEKYGNRRSKFGNNVGKFSRGGDKGGRFSRGDDKGGRFSRGDDKGGKFSRGGEKGGKFSRGGDKGGKFGRGGDKGGRFKGKSDKFQSKGKGKFDSKFKGGNKKRVSKRR